MAFLRKQSEPQGDTFTSLNVLFQSLHDAVVVYDENLRIIFANESFEKFVEFPLHELKHIPIEPSLLKDARHFCLGMVFFPSIAAKNITLLQQKPISVARIEIQNPKELHLVLSTFDVHDGGKKYLARVIFDNTQNIKKEKEIIEFLNLAAHHIRTPLSEIQWALESIATDTLSAEDKEIFQKTRLTIKNTLMLAEGILMSIKVDEGRIQTFEEKADLEILIQDLRIMLDEVLSEKNITFSLLVDQNVKTFTLDKKILSVCLFSLLENGALYNRRNGTLEVRAQKVPGRSFAEISVKDSGIGIPENEQKNIFEKYFRGTKAREIKPQGFGLGIYLAKKLIETIGGSLRLESKEGEGTTFFIQVPYK